MQSNGNNANARHSSILEVQIQPKEAESTRLRKLLAREDNIVIAPGVYDGLSARIALQTDFECLYITGAGVSISRLGLPDTGFASADDMVAQCGMIASISPLPCIADMDTGYGSPPQVARTVRRYIAAGLAGFHLEDQVVSKRCGHLAGKQLVPLEEYLARIRAAVYARSEAGSDIVIIARSDAAQGLGVDEALRRLQAAIACGADVAFLEAIDTKENLQRVVQTLAPTPVLLNSVVGGVTPNWTAAEAREMGVKLMILPGGGLVTACSALAAHYQHVYAYGIDAVPKGGMSPKKLFQLAGLDEVMHIDKIAGGNAFSNGSTLMRDKVLVYSDEGASQQGVLNCRSILRSLLGHLYDVKLVKAANLVREPWAETTALLVFPGGRDLPYQRLLQGKGNSEIRKYVENGGSFLGICAGAYYGARNIEFEKGTALQVIGERDLVFYPASCKGAAFPGFVYDSEAGARDVQLDIDPALKVDKQLSCYWNGGGYFEEVAVNDAASNVEILARYSDRADKGAAVTYSKVGRGAAILCSVHPEHPPVQFTKEAWTAQVDFFSSLLTKLGLRVQTTQELDNRPTHQFLLHSDQHKQQLVVDTILENFAADVGDQMQDSSDTFMLVRNASETHYEDEIRRIVVDQPVPKQDFDSTAFFQHLSTKLLGQALLYGSIVTSTQTLLDQNPKFLGCLPHGTVSLASRQLAGRGRGGNTWLSPSGCLMMSAVLHAPSKLASKIVFVQYLWALAVVEALQYGIGRTEHKIGLCIKWPNDIYADLGGHLAFAQRYVKIGGIIVNSSFSNGQFCLVVGCGLNLSNSQPTLTVNSLLLRTTELSGEMAATLTSEEALAAILSRFEPMWNELLQTNSFEPFMDSYHSNWIHSNQRITLDETGELAQILAITPDFGLLQVKAANGRILELQPDGNSFDMFRGLLKKKQ